MALIGSNVFEKHGRKYVGRQVLISLQSSVLNTTLTFESLKGSLFAKINQKHTLKYHRIVEKQKKLMALKITLSASVLLLIFREKKASFNSFVVRCLSCKVVLIFFTKLSKTLLGREIFLSRDYSISVKNPLGFLAISFPKVYISYQQ